MPFRDWIKELPGGFKLLVRRTTEGAELVDFAVVLLYENECITRYDTAHGYAHRDVLGRKSALIRKERYANLSTWEVFQNAINDLSTNYEAHYAFFAAH
jgi:hypothetical protein